MNELERIINDAWENKDQINQNKMRDKIEEKSDITFKSS